ncbi:MAG: hypothetical protein HC800_10395 [Phormidesmis sp. RL_2_1]|nr:hypothetical protein [Phormidesmis sp. RL_2_1]
MSLESSLRTLSTTACSVAMITVGAITVGAMVDINRPAIAQDYTAWLQDNASTQVTGYFLQGESIYGSCDQDCNDINMFLFNEMGVMVDADDAIDATPIVTAPYEGTFVIQVKMPSCTHGLGCRLFVSSDNGF